MTSNDITSPPIAADTRIRPYRISVPQANLDDLRERLARTRWARDLPGTGWERGVRASDLRDLAGLGQGVRLAGCEAALDAYPQFITTIDGASGSSCTCLRPAGRYPAAAPARLAGLDRGVPGRPAHRPGRLRRRPGRRLPIGDPVAAGLRILRSADRDRLDGRPQPAALAELMDRLGYDRYGEQGGDVGAFVGPLSAGPAGRVIGVTSTRWSPSPPATRPRWPP